MAEKAENLSIRLPPDLKRQVAATARAFGIAPADIIRLCVREGLPVLEEVFRFMRQRFDAMRADPTYFPSPPSGSLNDAPAPTPPNPANPRRR
jgi:hypothetical protein